MSVPALKPDFFSTLYQSFQAPIQDLDCGARCAPYNEKGVPFCCDTRHSVPAAYQGEWAYLQANTDLWHPWQGETATLDRELRAETPPGQVLIACLGHTHCQREFRALTCRAFPFFPYLSSGGDFLGLSYYWDYEDRCWVISNLAVVTPAYHKEFMAAFERLFDHLPAERETFAHHSAEMRRIFFHRRRAIPLLHRNGGYYKVSPRSERARRVPPDRLPRFGPYKIAEQIPFPDGS